MSETRQMARPDSTRWLYRTDRGDFGPMTTEKLLDAITAKVVALGTPVTRLGSGVWIPAGEVDILRNHYATCHSIWEQQALHAETDRLGKKLERANATRKGAWVGVLVAVVVVLAGAGVLWWRLSLAEAIGFQGLARAEEPPSLPQVTPRAAEIVEFPEATPKRVAVLPELELLDTAGVRVGDAAAPIANKMVFDESGEVRAIAPDALARIAEDARRGLVECAQQLVRTNDAFTGTEVSFLVSPKRLTDFSVGREVAGSPTFRACVKTALARVQVPDFDGNPRRITVPLRIGR